MKNILQIIQPHIVEGTRLMLRIFLYAAMGLYLVYALLAMGFPYPLDYGEAPLIDQARRLAAGENIYRPNIDTPPYTISNYPPVFIVAMSPLVNLAESVFLAGRAISILSAIATAIFLGLIIIVVAKDQFAAISAGMLFLAMSYVVYWSTLARVDLLALALSTAAIWLVVRQPESRFAIIGAGLLLVTAAYTRQSYALAAPLTLFIWLWFQNRRRSLELLAIVAGIGLILFALLTAITSGGFFFHIITANVNAFSLARIGRRFGELALLMPLLLVLAVLFIVAGRNRVSDWRLLAVYLIGGLLSALTIGKIGATVNYFLELIAAVCLIAGVFIAANRQHPWRYAVLLILLALQTGWFMQNTLDRWVDGWLTPRRSASLLLQSIAYDTTTVDGPILADEYMGLLTTQNSPLYFQPFEMTQLANAGRWDQTGLLTQIEQHLFPRIMIYHEPFSMLHETRWTPEILDTIAANYRPTLMMAGNVVYQPYTNSASIAISEPILATSFSPETAQTGPISRINETNSVFQLDMAVNPSETNHLAAAVTTLNDSTCASQPCPTHLLLYTSIDGGETWREQLPFTGGRGASSGGQVAFGSDNILYALGIRDGAITVNWANANQEYGMSLDNQAEVTRSQVDTIPRLNIDQNMDELYISFDSQYEDRVLTAPSLTHSSDQGQSWSRTIPVDQYVAMDDYLRGQATLSSDIHSLFGDGENMAMVWIWSPDPWHWPRDIWLARSTDGGDSFSEPAHIAETWGPTSVATRSDTYYLLYRTGTESASKLTLAISEDAGLTWTSTIVSDAIPLSFNVDMSPAIDIAANGTIDISFYTQVESCMLTMKAWQDSLSNRTIEACDFDVYYTYSQDNARSFSEPLKLNDSPIRGETLIRFNEPASDGLRTVVASADEVATVAWIGTDASAETAAYSVRIMR